MGSKEDSMESVLSLKADAFSVRIINMVKYLNANADKGMKPLFTQILRSGTSISANIGEAQYAQTKADFVTKLHISLKEASETRKWLQMLTESEVISSVQSKSMNADLDELFAMLVSSIKTVKNNI